MKTSSRIGHSDLAPIAVARRCSTTIGRRRHREGAHQRGKREHHGQHREIRALPETTDARPSSSLEQFGAGRSQRECDVVVRAGVHAVEAQRAIEVADLHREEESQLAPALLSHFP